MAQELSRKEFDNMNRDVFELIGNNEVVNESDLVQLLVESSPSISHDKKLDFRRDKRIF